MRRKEKEITDQIVLEDILARALVVRLGLIDGQEPYIVPLCFGYAENTLYVHGALQGRKMDLVRQNPEVCFELEAGVEILQSDAPCKWSLKFKSVIGWGHARIVADPLEKAKALGIIMAHYGGKTAEPWAFPDAGLRGTAVISIRISRMTGKQSGF
ncbi:MAG: pyridoxamine 5'-phosphate oxidase family protein [Pseudomonadota bacterium]